MSLRRPSRETPTRRRGRWARERRREPARREEKVRARACPRRDIDSPEPEGSRHATRRARCRSRRGRAPPLGPIARRRFPCSFSFQGGREIPIVGPADVRAPKSTASILVHREKPSRPFFAHPSRSLPIAPDARDARIPTRISPQTTPGAQSVCPTPLRRFPTTRTSRSRRSPTVARPRAPTSSATSSGSTRRRRSARAAASSPAPGARRRRRRRRARTSGGCRRLSHRKPAPTTPRAPRS